LQVLPSSLSVHNNRDQIGRNRKTNRGALNCLLLDGYTYVRITYRNSLPKIIQTRRFAERLGADILGIGAFTSVVGDGGVTIVDVLDIPVTTGDAYTISTALSTVREVTKVMDMEIKRVTAVVVAPQVPPVRSVLKSWLWKSRACLAETMILVRERRFEDNTIGKNIPRNQVEETPVLCKKN
jgi:predicted amino acid dehydrogenase